MLFGSSGRVIGERERTFMKKKIRYTDEPLGDVRIVDDFLPSPGELAFNEEQVKVTIGLSRNSIEFFKKQAKKHRTQYQKMIRRLLDIYVARHQKRSTD
jgi:hypothetical protein